MESLPGIKDIGPLTYLLINKEKNLVAHPILHSVLHFSVAIYIQAKQQYKVCRLAG